MKKIKIILIVLILIILVLVGNFYLNFIIFTDNILSALFEIFFTFLCIIFENIFDKKNNNECMGNVPSSCHCVSKSDDDSERRLYEERLFNEREAAMDSPFEVKTSHVRESPVTTEIIKEAASGAIIGGIAGGTSKLVIGQAISKSEIISSAVAGSVFGAGYLLKENLMHAPDTNSNINKITVSNAPKHEETKEDN